MTKNIRGKVARILNIRELVLNVGAVAGVQTGMIFDVLDSKGENIVDPDTGLEIGSLSRVKVQVRIKAVQERLSVAETFNKIELSIGRSTVTPVYRSSLNALAQLFMESDTSTKYETLKTTGKEFDPLDDKDSYVKVGDIAVCILPDLPEAVTEDDVDEV